MDHTDLSWNWQPGKSVSVVARTLSLEGNMPIRQQQGELHNSVENYCAGEVQAEKRPHEHLCFQSGRMPTPS